MEYREIHIMLIL